MLPLDRQDDMSWLACLALPHNDNAGISVEIRDVHGGQFGVAAPRQHRAADEIAERAEGAGLSRERPIITYCHRGARAATALYALRLAGFEARIFVGSWHEWAADAFRPVCSGA